MSNTRVDTDSDSIRRFMESYKSQESEWHAAPPAQFGPEPRALTSEQVDKLTADLRDFVLADVSAMPVTPAPIGPADADGTLHFKKQSDPGY